MGDSGNLEDCRNQVLDTLIIDRMELPAGCRVQSLENR